MAEHRPDPAVSKLPEGERVAAVTTTVAVGRTPFTQHLGRIALVAVGVLFTIFALVNSQRVDFNWIFGETIVQRTAQGSDLVRTSGGVPLIILLVGSFVLGAVFATLAGWRRHRRKAVPVAKVKKQRARKAD